MFMRTHMLHSLRMETLEKRELLTASAQLVHDFDFNFGSWNSPISVVAAEDNTYQIVRQRDEQGADYYLIGQMDGDSPSRIKVEERIIRDSEVAVGDQLYFVIERDDSMQELWKTDATEDGTARLLSLPSPKGGIANLTTFDDALYFSVDTELWMTDGTETGTRLIKDLKPNQTSCKGTCTEWFSHGHTELKGMLFFTMTPKCYSWTSPTCQGTELWKSDGTSDGTQLVTTIRDTAAIIAATKSHIFLEGYQNQLWWTDGSDQGTYRLPDMYDVDRFAVANDRLFFVKNFTLPGRDRHEVWVSDGTNEGTHLVKETLLSGNIRGCGVSGLLSAGDTIYFSAQDESDNHGLWKSDGTEEGTVLVKEMWLAPLVAADNLVYLVGYDGALWRTDGTSAGTRQVVDLNPGPEDSLTRLSEAVPNNGMLYFTADDGVHGFDLWRIPIEPTLKDQTTGSVNNDVALLPGDADGDGSVDFQDFLLLSQHFGKAHDAAIAEGDFDGNGAVNFADFLVLSNNFGSTQTAAHVGGDEAI